MDQLCYKVGKDIYTSYSGAEIVLRKSKNLKAIANAEELLVLLKKCFDDLLKKMHVTRSSQASSSGGKERRVATTNHLAPIPPRGPVVHGGGSMQEYNQPERLYTQSIDGCGQSVVRFDRDTSQSIVKDSAGLQALTTEVVKYRQSVDGCAESLVKYNSEAAQSGIKDVAGLQVLTTEVVKYQQSVDGCSESLVKYNSEVAKGPTIQTLQALSAEMLSCAQSFSKFSESYTKFGEDYLDFANKKKYMAEVDEKVSVSAKENAEREIEVKKLASLSAKENAEREIEVKKLASLSAKENAEREMEVEKLKNEMELLHRQNLLKMEQEELKFSQEKKRALEEEESPSQKNKKNKQQDEDKDEEDEEDFITVRDMAKKHMMDIFAGVPLCDHAEIIKEAGGYASRRYKASTGKRMLSKVYRGGYQVCCYPREEESFVIHTLRWAVGEYKKKKGLSASAGASQATLSNMWTMGQNAKASSSSS